MTLLRRLRIGQTVILKTISEMVRFAEQFVKIKAVLFDRGFYDSDIVKQLEDRNIGYVIGL